VHKAKNAFIPDVVNQRLQRISQNRIRPLIDPLNPETIAWSIGLPSYWSRVLATRALIEWLLKILLHTYNFAMVSGKAPISTRLLQQVVGGFLMRIKISFSGLPVKE
jgi:hypothetical protein